VLGAIRVENGCMVVSSFDAIKESVTLEPAPAENVDWQKLLDAEIGPNKDTISVSALAGRKDVANFVVGQFDRLTNASPCTSHESEPLRVVIVLSHGLQLPDGSRKTKMEACGCKLFYLRQTDTLIDSDDLKGMLSSLSPQVLDFSNPEQFRQRLADLIRAIEKIGQ
jgi:hypothetical protein